MDAATMTASTGFILIPHLCGIRPDKRVLAAEPELINRENHGAWTNLSDAHTANRRAIRHAVLRIRLEVAHDGDGATTRCFVQDSDESEIGQQRTEIVGEDEREEWIASSLTFVRERFACHGRTELARR